MEIRIRRLAAHDDRRQFHSGHRDIDRFFADFAGLAQYCHHIGTTFVAKEEGRIVGILNLAATHLEIDGLTSTRKRKLPDYPLPVLRLARLAVAGQERGRGIGFALLRTAFFIARKMQDGPGCAGVVVDAKPEAVEFYERHGFMILEALEGTLGDRPQPVPMFLPLGSIPAVE